jgi:hypothetical protein
MSLVFLGHSALADDEPAYAFGILTEATERMKSVVTSDISYIAWKGSSPWPWPARTGTGPSRCAATATPSPPTARYCRPCGRRHWSGTSN